MTPIQTQQERMEKTIAYFLELREPHLQKLKAEADGIVSEYNHSIFRSAVLGDGLSVMRGSETPEAVDRAQIISALINAILIDRALDDNDPEKGEVNLYEIAGISTPRGQGPQTYATGWTPEAA